MQTFSFPTVPYFKKERMNAMIYTCTLNTAIDMFIEMEDFLPDKVNRSIYDEFQPNGKGVNISIILNKLGTPSTALGYIAGFSGHYIQDELKKNGHQHGFYRSRWRHKN